MSTDLQAANAQFEADVLNGLSRAQKTLPCRWLYDEHGSQLFEEITQLEEYYPTRTETAILKTHAGQIATHIGPDAALIEYGAGASVKTRILLDALPDLGAYLPIDISGAFLEQTVSNLQADYAHLTIQPIIADFLGDIRLPRLTAKGAKVGFFPGSTIGNLSDSEINQFLTRARRVLGDKGLFILGVDLVKPLDVLLAAYDDREGVTAAFNLNFLRRINRELDGDFAMDQFAHEARWNAGASQIEMHLVSQRSQTVRVAGRPFSFARGETIHTENSRKFDLDQLKAMFARCGWKVPKVWTDARDYFAVILLESETG